MKTITLFLFAACVIAAVYAYPSEVEEKPAHLLEPTDAESDGERAKRSPQYGYGGYGNYGRGNYGGNYGYGRNYGGYGGGRGYNSYGGYGGYGGRGYNGGYGGYGGRGGSYYG